jgi:hypothetical protein
MIDRAPVRLADWKARLWQYLQTCAAAPLEPGSHDCALFVAGAVCAMTGVDLAAPYRGRYDTFKTGFKLLTADGWPDAQAFLSAHFSPIHPALAHEGDIVVLRGGRRLALGLLQGEVIYVLQDRNLALRPRSAARSAYHVPFIGEAA